MNRVRISTTVDGAILEAARNQLGLRDAELFDKALKAVLRDALIANELAALERHPYEADLELRMPKPEPLAATDAFDQTVPARVRKLAQLRRAQIRDERAQ